MIETILTIAMIAVFCADIGTTWYLLIKYCDRVREAGPLGRLLRGYYGQLVFVSVRIVLLALVVQMGWPAMLLWSLVTLYAVINNLIVMKGLKS